MFRVAFGHPSPWPRSARSRLVAGISRCSAAGSGAARLRARETGAGWAWEERAEINAIDQPLASGMFSLLVTIYLLFVPPRVSERPGLRVRNPKRGREGEGKGERSDGERWTDRLETLCFRLRAAELTRIRRARISRRRGADSARAQVLCIFKPFPSDSFMMG